MLKLRGCLAVLVSLSLPFRLFGQQASLSPALSRALPPDTVVAVWVFARPQYSLAQITSVVAGLGGRLRRESRWLHAVSADLSGPAIGIARGRPEILRLQPVARFVGGPPQPVVPVTALAPPRYGAPPLDSVYGASAMPFRRLNLFPLVQGGLRGAGVRIAMLDTGFETGRSIFSTAMVIGQRDFVFNDSIVRNQGNDAPGASDHGTATWSLLAANASGTMVGIAPEAQYILAKTEDVRGETRVEEDNYVAALEWADSLGAKIVSSSLGYLCFPENCATATFSYATGQLNGDVAVTTVAADLAAQRGITVVTAMGNSGPAPQSLSTPADGDSVISLGSVDSLGNLAPSSSRGPTADGRIKPDLTAPGVAVFVATPSGFGRGSGTSFSTPIAAGAAALMKQAHLSFGPIAIRDALRLAGSNARSPDSNRGWGTPDVTLAATFPDGVTLLEPLDSIIATRTPRFSWAAPNVPGFAQPVRYRLVLARDTTFATPLVDTVVTGTTLQSPSLGPGTRFFLRLTATAQDSAVVRVQPATRFVIRGDVEASPPITLLFQNFPNPFPERTTGQASTCIWFDVASPGRVRLDILDLRGHVVKNLVPGRIFDSELPAGHYGRSGAADTGCDPDFSWNGTASDGSVAPQGVYLLRLETADGTLFKRIVFLGLP
ncbi:MAG: S8 family serine peptidase [Gemmatimonadetes bacterium]|nr:S8 family serine peptidase [Gemmatimonadota bacterium]